MKPLVVTPSPNPTESLLGYLLRVSEKNGYETPTHVLDYAEITRREALSPFFPIDRLATVLGKRSKELLPIAYSARNSAGALQFRILKHDLGQSIKGRTYRLARPAFCPHCVAEKGYLEAHWDIELVTACPRHACKLLAICPACGKHIGWHRRGLLTCECGQDWSDIKMEPADATSVEMLTILVSKILGTPIEASLSAGMPIEQLSGMALPTLLGAIRAIGKFAEMNEEPRGIDLPRLVSKAATTFANWPANFERLIDTVAANGGRGLQHFQSALALAGVAEDNGRFIRDSIRCRIAALPPLNPKGARHIPKGARHIPKGARHIPKGARHIPKGARHIPKGARHIPKRGMRTVAASYATSSPIRYDSMGERRAAAYLGIPVSALRSLRTSGHYRVLNIPIPTSAYHVKDLDTFQRKVLDCAPMCAIADKGDILSLEYILQEFRFRSNTGKGELLAAIMDGVIPPIGRTSDRIPDIVLRKSDVIAFRDKTRIRAEGETLSPAETAKYLNCDPMILPGLINAGSLEAIRVPGGIRLTQSSIKKFDTTYISVAKLAKTIGTSSRRLQHEMRKWNIPLTEFDRGYGKSKQAFVSIEYEDRLPTIFDHLNATVRSRMSIRTQFGT